jgi:phosphoribosylformylglycinamidine synthase
MKWGVVTFPGSNDDEDARSVVRDLLGHETVALWHKDRELHDVDAVILPGGFSYGDYLRCGALARFSPVMRSIAEFAADGGLVLGICNGFQILCEAGLLPGALIRNRSLRFVCEAVTIRVENADTPLTALCSPEQRLIVPIKHGEGCYVADAETLDGLEASGQILFRYVDAAGEPTEAANPNGSLGNVAGVCNPGRNVFGMMPHPEHASDPALARDDGLVLFRSLAEHAMSGARPPRAAAGQVS